MNEKVILPFGMGDGIYRVSGEVHGTIVKDTNMSLKEIHPLMRKLICGYIKSYGQAFFENNELLVRCINDILNHTDGAFEIKNIFINNFEKYGKPQQLSSFSITIPTKNVMIQRVPENYKLEVLFGGLSGSGVGCLHYSGHLFGKVDQNWYKSTPEEERKQMADTIQDILLPLIKHYVNRHGVSFFTDKALLSQFSNELYHQTNEFFKPFEIVNLLVNQDITPKRKFLNHYGVFVEKEGESKPVDLPYIIEIESNDLEEGLDKTKQDIPTDQSAKMKEEKQSTVEEKAKPTSVPSENTTTIEFYTDSAYHMHTHNKYKVSGSIEGTMLDTPSSGQLNNLKMYINSCLEDTIYRFGENAFSNARYIQYFTNSINQYFGHLFKMDKIKIDSFAQLENGKEIPVSIVDEVNTEEEYDPNNN